MKYNIQVIWSLLLVIGCSVSLAQEKLIDRVVATVGTSTILQSEIENEYTQALIQGMQPNEEYKCYLLQQLLTQKLLAQQAAIDSIEVSESEVDDELNRRMRFMTQQAGGKERLEEFLNRSTLQYKEEMRPHIGELLLAQRMQQHIMQKIDVTPLEVKRYFDGLDQDSLPYFNTEVEIGQIVMYPKLTREEKEQFRKRAEDLRQRVLDGSDFGTVARLYSEDGSSVHGGELGFATRETYVKEFSAQAFKLKEGEISEVFETEYGFHFLQVLARRGEEVNVRHVLIKIKPTNEALARTKEKLDSIQQDVVSGKIPFHTAASLYSDDKNTKFNGGMLINEQSENRTTLIPVDELDVETFRAIDAVEEGKFSDTYQFTEQREGKIGYKFNYLKRRIPPHQANLDQDYAKIQDAAMQDKINRKLSKWFEGRRLKTYINIHEDFQRCDELKIWTEDSGQVVASSN